MSYPDLYLLVDGERLGAERSPHHSRSQSRHRRNAGPVAAGDAGRSGSRARRDTARPGPCGARWGRRHAARSCTRRPTCCASASKRCARVATMEMGKTLPETRVELHDGGGDLRLVCRRRPPRLWPRAAAARGRHAHDGGEGTGGSGGRLRALEFPAGQSGTQAGLAAGRGLQRHPEARRGIARQRTGRGAGACSMRACRRARCRWCSACRPRFRSI